MLVTGIFSFFLRLYKVPKPLYSLKFSSFYFRFIISAIVDSHYLMNSYNLHEFRFITRILLHTFFFYADCQLLNSLPNNKFVDWSKLKAFADNKINASLPHKFFFGMVGNHCEKRRKCCLRLLFPIVWEKVNISFSLVSLSSANTTVRIHQPFSRTFFVFVHKICKFECNTTSDWLNRTV